MVCAGVDETGTSSDNGLLRKLYPKQRLDDITALFLYPVFELMCVFLHCSAGVLHDSVSETQSQREAREEARE